MNGEKSIKDFNKEYKVAKGAFATVFAYRSKISGKKYAVKKIRFLPEKYRNRESFQLQVSREYSLCKRMNHQNIVKTYAKYDHLDVVYIVQELCGISLEQFQEKLHPKGVPEEVVKKILIQIVNAMLYLHENGVAHRDIAPKNILFAFNSTSEVKLIDFGLSKKIHPDEVMASIAGTPAFMAPEIHSGNYTASADVYSLGVVLCNLLTGKNPHWDSAASIPPASPECRDLIKKCLAYPHIRIHLVDLAKHPFLLGGDSGMDTLKYSQIGSTKSSASALEQCRKLGVIIPPRLLTCLSVDGQQLTEHKENYLDSSSSEEFLITRPAITYPSKSIVKPLSDVNINTRTSGMKSFKKFDSRLLPVFEDKIKVTRTKSQTLYSNDFGDLIFTKFHRKTCFALLITQNATRIDAYTKTKPSFSRPFKFKRAISAILEAAEENVVVVENVNTQKDPVNPNIVKYYNLVGKIVERKRRETGDEAVIAKSLKHQYSENDCVEIAITNNLLNYHAFFIHDSNHYHIVRRKEEIVFYKTANQRETMHKRLVPEEINKQSILSKLLHQAETSFIICQQLYKSRSRSNCLSIET